MTDKAIQFQTELECLIRKYKPTLDIEYELYGDYVEEVHFIVDDFIVASKPCGYGIDKWDFGQGLETI